MASNSVEIIGLLSENNLEEGSYEKDGRKGDYIRGSVTVKVVQKIGAAEKVLEIPVHVYANKLKKDGGENPAYKSWKEVFGYTSIAAGGGEDKADAVRVSGQLVMNEYYGRDNRFNSYPQVKGSFIKKIRKDDMKMGAVFEYDGMIRQTCNEVDSQGVETGRLRINMCIPQWGGLVDVMPFYVESPKGNDFIMDNWKPRDTVPFRGKLNFSTKTETKVIETAFGDPEEKTTTTSISELIITGGDFPLESGYEFSMIEEGLRKRDEKLAAEKEKTRTAPKTKRAPTASTASTADVSRLGF